MLPLEFSWMLVYNRIHWGSLLGRECLLTMSGHVWLRALMSSAALVKLSGEHLLHSVISISNSFG